MKPAHNFIIIVAIIGIVVAVSGSIYYVFNKATSQISQQPNQEIAQKPSGSEGKVLAGCPGCIGISFYLKESGTNTIVTGATAELLTKDPFTTDSWFFTYVAQSQLYNNGTELNNLALKPGQSMPATVSVKIEESGYQSKTTTVSTSTESIVYLSKATTSSNNSSTPPSSTSQTTTTTTAQTETVKGVSLPKIFTQKGSSTTNLAEIKDLKKVENFTVEVKDKNKIVWNEAINLSETDIANKFKSLDKYIKAGKIGVVEVDSKTLSPFSKKKASITMQNLKLLETPYILIDGKPDTEDITSNVVYEKGTLSFNVTSFSKFEAVPKLEIMEPKDGFNFEDPKLTLRGKISDPEASVSVKLNNQSIGNLKVTTDNGRFSKDLTLSEGDNKIVVEAISKFGPPLVATVSGVFTPKGGFAFSNKTIGIGALVVLLLLIAASWLYYKRKKASNSTPA